MSPPEENNIEIQWPELFTSLKGLIQGAKNTLAPKRETIPIVFVPGIMGTRLKNSSGEKVWDPDDKLFMLKKFGLAWVDAKDKKATIVGEKFDEDFLQPFLDDAKHNKKQFQSFAGADERGWGGVSWSSYGNILTALQTHSWPQVVRLCFELPVYACGYNWTASNSTAGKKLKEFIDKVVADNSSEGNTCEHVILVTHSMGGLVTRSACIEHGANAKVLGIIHGVQPVTGAAAAYWRMKAGFERHGLIDPAAWVLGSNGEEVTALLGNMPGGLQLLPSQDYTANDGSPQWLQFHDDTGKQVAALPKGGDPYEEIYKVRNRYWQLATPALLAPELESDAPTGPETIWSGFTQLLDKTKAFHQRVGLSPNVQTQVFYGSGKEHETADRVVYKLSPEGWKLFKWGDKDEEKSFDEAVYLGDGAYESDSSDSRSSSGFKSKVHRDDARLKVSLQVADGAGDGTVPESSGKALKVDATGIPKIEHEPAYKEEAAQGFTFKAIAKFCNAKIDKRIGK